MSTIKVGKDCIANEEQVVLELDTLIHSLLDLRQILRPYSEQAKESGISVPQYMATARNALTEFCKGTLAVTYPSLNQVVTNGNTCMATTWRLHDAIGRIKQLEEKLEKAKCLVRNDTDAATFTSYVNAAIGSLCIYTIEQLHLHAYEVPPDLSVYKHTQKLSVSPDVWYGQLLDVLHSTSVVPYGYEAMSPYYGGIETLIPNGLLSEMEDNQFPLTAKLCDDLVEGRITVSDLETAFAKFKQDDVEENLSSKITPGNLMSKLKLED